MKTIEVRRWFLFLPYPLKYYENNHNIWVYCTIYNKIDI